ncbi:MAG: hypothetical protein IH991_00895 [Planctomycetes bacterium]|nr:hypothetical protein [Planctomycetota bacterium]
MLATFCQDAALSPLRWGFLQWKPRSRRSGLLRSQARYGASVDEDGDVWPFGMEAVVEALESSRMETAFLPVVRAASCGRTALRLVPRLRSAALQVGSRSTAPSLLVPRRAVAPPLYKAEFGILASYCFVAGIHALAAGRTHSLGLHGRNVNRGAASITLASLFAASARSTLRAVARLLAVQPLAASENRLAIQPVYLRGRFLGPCYAAAAGRWAAGRSAPLAIHGSLRGCHPGTAAVMAAIVHDRR